MKSENQNNNCNNNNNNDNNNYNIHNNNKNNKLPKAVSTRVGKEVERPYLKKLPNLICVMYSL